MTGQNKRYHGGRHGYWYRYRLNAFVILIAVFFLSACTSTSRQAPVSSRIPPPSIKSSQHMVSAGETLYSIAWRYDLDYKNLARANGISPAYKIYPGQAIYLNDKIGAGSQPRSSVSCANVNASSPPRDKKTPTDEHTSPE